MRQDTCNSTIRIVRVELKRRECNAMGHAFVRIRRQIQMHDTSNKILGIE